MEENHHEDLVPFPLVRLAQGGRSPDGKALLMEASMSDGRLLRFAIPLCDIQHFVSFLLVSADRISATREAQERSTTAEVPDGAPIPVTSIAFGGVTGDEAYLEIAVGQAVLTFSVPLSALDPLARTMLTISARPDSRYKM